MRYGLNVVNLSLLSSRQFGELCLLGQMSLFLALLGACQLRLRAFIISLSRGLLDYLTNPPFSASYCM
jgi:hypothetical protein